MRDLQEIRELIKLPKDVAIVTHRNPDGDAMGASLALFHFLARNHHSPKILIPSDFPVFFRWMPSSDQILIYDTEPERCIDTLRRANLIFYLDFNALDRIDKMGEINHELKARKILVDHHVDPEPFADHIYWDVTASSTSELIFEILAEISPASLKETDIAEALLTGILTDTGTFQYGVSPRVLRVTASLLETDVHYEKIQNLVFNNMSQKQLRLLGHCLNRRMKIIDRLRTGIIWLSRNDFKDFDIQRGDTEGIVNYLLKLQDVDVAIFITEQPNIVKLSFRSKGEISVQALARDHFNGGGHRNASGGYMHSSLRTAIGKLEEVLPNYI